MSAEINYSVSVNISKGGLSVTGSASNAKDMTGVDMESLTVPTTTAATLLPVGALAQLETILIKNTDPTNSVQLYLDAGATQRFATVKPNSFVLLDSPPSVIYTKATAATPVLWVVACES